MPSRSRTEPSRTNMERGIWAEGWCPGMDVEPVRFDITNSITLGEEMTLSYRSLFEGEPYVPIPFDWGSVEASEH